jgi:hypothetical protein
VSPERTGANSVLLRAARCVRSSSERNVGRGDGGRLSIRLAESMLGGSVLASVLTTCGCGATPTGSGSTTGRPTTSKATTSPPPEGVTLGTTTRPSSPSTPLLSTATGATLGMTLAKGRALYPATDLTHEEGGSIVGPPSHCERNLGTRPAGTDQSCGNRSGRS